MRKYILSALVAVGLAASSTAALAAGGGPQKLDKQSWTFDGVFGYYDKAQLQRGFQVFNDVCSSCHTLSLVRYRNLMDIGLSEERVKELAAEIEVPGDIDDEGNETMRPGLPADPFKSPFPNEKAARAANNGALPPDLSLITKARVNGADYVYTLMTSYEDEMPEDVHLADGMSYNPAFPGHQIAMPAIISDESVEFEDGSPNKKEDIARDVVSFLTWAAEPELEVRKALGVKVMIFLFVMTALFYALKRQIWKRVDH